ncbi:unnamed protein product, partial [Ectocarpus sp. 12 AP-2014]
MPLAINNENLGKDTFPVRFIVAGSITYTTTFLHTCITIWPAYELRDGRSIRPTLQQVLRRLLVTHSLTL